MIQRAQLKTIVRVAPDNERTLVANVVRDAYAQFQVQYDARHWLEYEASTRETVLHQDGITRLVAVVGEEIAGAVLFCPPYERVMGGELVKNPYPEFRLLAVSPDFRDMGIGAMLIDACEEMVKAEGSKAITLHTTVVMETARLMYERRGYTRFTDIDFSPAPNFIVMGYKKDL
ncbi:MAG: GNAT family N-acetyltransferase [Cyanobacteria bacterium REEB67]|nr:GNAT family N-acetyltransferase [Cyanobacteria bacterium REEB67]